MPTLDEHFLAEIDDNRPELAFLREITGIPAAADAMVRYLATKPVPGGLDSPLDASHGKTDRMVADNAVAGRFTFQGATDDVPRLASGGFDWHHLGPHADREWAWFLNRHMYFRALARAHAETSDERYAIAFDAQLTDWIKQNPKPKEDTMGAPWRVMEAGTRLLQSWPQAFFGLRTATAFKADTRKKMLLSVIDHAEQLIAFHRHHHNHAIKEMAGLATAALAWPELRRAAGWYRYAIEVLDREVEWQVYPDGCHRELTSGYHITVLNYVASVITLADACGAPVPDRMRKTIHAMVDYLAGIMDPAGMAPLNNDSDLVDVRPLLARFSKEVGRPDWSEAAAGEIALYSRLYPHAGQIAMRFDKDFWAFFDFGAEGVAVTHNHADKLHLSVHAGGRPLLVDAGRATYVPNAIRHHVMGESAHNVVRFPGLVRKQDALIWDRPLADGAAGCTDGCDWALGRFLAGYDGSSGDLRQERVVVRHTNWLLVIDVLALDQARQAETLWHLHPDCTVSAKADGGETGDVGVGNIRIRQLSGPVNTFEVLEGKEEPELQGWYSPRYNKTVPAPTLVGRCTAPRNTALAWLIETGTGTPPKRDARVEAGQDALRIIIDDLAVSVTFVGSPHRIGTFRLERAGADHNALETVCFD